MVKSDHQKNASFQLKFIEEFIFFIAKSYKIIILYGITLALKIDNV